MSVTSLSALLEPGNSCQPPANCQSFTGGQQQAPSGRTVEKPRRGLYVHVPFCAQKCSYCAFYSQASSGELVNRYVRALILELEQIAGQFRPRTVFFGGGTPSILNLRQWQEILRAMERLNLLGAPEFTVECNPATVSLDKAKLLHDYGVNRLSMGVQSLDEDLLNRLGRVHDRGMVFRSWDILRGAGFDNLNLDLMFGIPGQTMRMWTETLREAVSLGSEHLSSYELIYEEDTLLYDQMRARQFEVNEDLNCAMYEALVEHAAAADFIQYEIANFARRTTLRQGAEKWENSFACRHNVNYWRGGEFHAAGPSATAYVGGVRTKNWSNTVKYCELLEQGGAAVENTEALPPLSRAGEIAAFGLRMVDGWPFEEFIERTGKDLRQDFADALDDLIRQGWGVVEQDRVRLTPRGLRFADGAAQLFLG